MTLSGISLIGAERAKATGPSFAAMNPRTGERLPGDFFAASQADVERAAEQAAKAFEIYGTIPGRKKGELLRAIAAEIEAIVEPLVERAELETALPKARLQGETARTCGQLRLFAQVVEEGSWVMARIDRPEPDRKPAPKPDLRSMLHSLGPVVVFGASNFPLAFSVAGGDTASALAAGNPLIVKAHPAHPGTSELVGLAIQRSIRQCGLPEGVFSLLFDSGTEIGVALVKHPAVKAVGFTGSRRGGKALMDIAAARREPIPVFAEMSSVNPVFILPGALRQRAEAIATGLNSSFTLGAGQFCTKPGLVFLPNGTESAEFGRRLAALVSGSTPFTLLTAGISSAYGSAVADRKARPGATLLAEIGVAGKPGCEAGASLFETDAAAFLSHPELADEIFGPSTLLVRHSDRNQLRQAIEHLEGHLTATIHGTEEDLRDYADLVSLLRNKVGRLVFNGFPTGVEVAHAMVHGGPFPATSDGRSTSVGSQAIFRFARPVCYQGFPESVLPQELQDSNPLGIWRMVDGQITRDGIA